MSVIIPRCDFFCVPHHGLCSYFPFRLTYYTLYIYVNQYFTQSVIVDTQNVSNVLRSKYYKDDFASFLCIKPSLLCLDRVSVCPMVITRKKPARYKSSRLFGLVRLKLTYQPAPVLYIFLNPRWWQNLRPGIAFCKMIKLPKHP